MITTFPRWIYFHLWTWVFHKNRGKILIFLWANSLSKIFWRLIHVAHWWDPHPLSYTDPIHEYSRCTRMRFTYYKYRTVVQNNILTFFITVKFVMKIREIIHNHWIYVWKMIKTISFKICYYKRITYSISFVQHTCPIIHRFQIKPTLETPPLDFPKKLLK